MVNEEKQGEQILNAAILHIKNETYNYYGGYSSEDIMQWLKSLKDRILPQPKQEWSEEDNNILNGIIAYLSCNACDLEGFDRWYDWLKSLKDRYVPQKQWKPSEKQMGTLEKWLEQNRYNGNYRYAWPIFESLFNDLKAL